jgi:hypothetical protein
VPGPPAGAPFRSKGCLLAAHAGLPPVAACGQRAGGAEGGRDPVSGGDLPAAEGAGSRVSGVGVTCSGGCAGAARQTRQPSGLLPAAENEGLTGAGGVARRLRAARYTPDVDYLDGYLEQRNAGTKAHGKMTFHVKKLDDRGTRRAYRDAAADQPHAVWGARCLRVSERARRRDIHKTAPVVGGGTVAGRSDERRCDACERVPGDEVLVVWVIDPVGRGLYENAEASLSPGEVHLSLNEILLGGHEINRVRFGAIGRSGAAGVGFGGRITGEHSAGD